MIRSIDCKSILTVLLAAALIMTAVTDWRTYRIPQGLNVFIAVLGAAVTAVDALELRGITQRSLLGQAPVTVAAHLIGAVSVSGLLLIVYIVTKGRGIGGGDIKLMAAAGLFLGWKNCFVAFAIGCVAALIIQLVGMKVKGQGHEFAFGPYLAAGILIASLWGDRI